MLPIIILILSYIVLYKIVTSIGVFQCRKVETPFGRAVDITLQLGMTPIHNTVSGKIVCNDQTEQSAQFRPLPSMYCPTSLGGDLSAVERLIDDTCGRNLPSETPAVIEEIFEEAPSSTPGPLRRRKV